MAQLDNPARGITTGRTAVTTAGTRVQLSSVSSGVITVCIQAENDNTGKIAVGDANVVAALGSERGILLAAGQSVSLAIDQLTDIWIDATVSSDGVMYTYLTG